jgi:hypothetical protein
VRTLVREHGRELRGIEDGQGAAGEHDSAGAPGQAVGGRLRDIEHHGGAGSPRQVPAGIGIPGAQAQNTAQCPFIVSGNCFYWLHTHAADGIIHIESPVHRVYTLGDFFDEWGLPLGPGQVGPARGHVTAIYNRRLYQGNPRDIPLTAHAQIQLEVGTPLVAPVSITWPGGL